MSISVRQRMRNMQEDILSNILYNDLSEDRVREFADSSTPCNTNEILEVSLRFPDWFREKTGDDTVFEHLEKKINNYLSEKAISFYNDIKAKLDELNDDFETEKECYKASDEKLRCKEDFKYVVNKWITGFFANQEHHKIIKEYYSYRITDFFDELES